SLPPPVNPVIGLPCGGGTCGVTLKTCAGHTELKRGITRRAPAGRAGRTTRETPMDARTRRQPRTRLLSLLLLLASGALPTSRGRPARARGGRGGALRSLPGDSRPGGAVLPRPRLAGPCARAVPGHRAGRIDRSPRRPPRPAAVRRRGRGGFPARAWTAV